jgi:hypothetical protein
VPKNIEIHRNPEGLEKGSFTWENPYFLRFRFLRRFLHAVEVTGSNPLSPIVPLPKTPTLSSPPDWQEG